MGELADPLVMPKTYHNWGPRPTTRPAESYLDGFPFSNQLDDIPSGPGPGSDELPMTSPAEIQLAFSPSRLLLARRRRRMSQSDLAAAIGMTPRMVRMYEPGERDPPPATIEKLAAALTFPAVFFAGPSLDLLADRQGGASFRALYALKARDRDAALSTGDLAALLSTSVERRFRLPELDLPDYSEADSDTLVDPTDRVHRAELAAQLLRAHWQLGDGPIASMFRLLEAKGVRVFRLSEEVEEVDAFCFWNSGRPFVMLNTAKSGERSRFDAAHELGHLVLHRPVREFGREEEEEANAFASAFLMPQASILRELPSVPAEPYLLALKPRWRVSMAALLRRGRDLGRYSEWQYKQVCIHLSQTGQRRAERDPLPHEYSLIYEKVLRALQNSGQTLSWLADAIDVTLEELWSFLPLPCGLEQTVRLPVAHGPAQRRSGQVVPFPRRSDD